MTKSHDDKYLAAAEAAHQGFLDRQEQTRAAKAARGLVFKSAQDNGISLRRIGQAVGLSHTAVEQAIAEVS